MERWVRKERETRSGKGERERKGSGLAEYEKQVEGSRGANNGRLNFGLDL